MWQDERTVKTAEQPRPALEKLKQAKSLKSNKKINRT